MLRHFIGRRVLPQAKRCQIAQRLRLDQFGAALAGDGDVLAVVVRRRVVPTEAGIGQRKIAERLALQGTVFRVASELQRLLVERDGLRVLLLEMLHVPQAQQDCALGLPVTCLPREVERLARMPVAPS